MSLNFTNHMDISQFPCRVTHLATWLSSDQWAAEEASGLLWKMLVDMKEERSGHTQVFLRELWVSGQVKTSHLMQISDRRGVRILLTKLRGSSSPWMSHPPPSPTPSTEMTGSKPLSLDCMYLWRTRRQPEAHMSQLSDPLPRVVFLPPKLSLRPLWPTPLFSRLPALTHGSS